MKKVEQRIYENVDSYGNYYAVGLIFIVNILLSIIKIDGAGIVFIDVWSWSVFAIILYFLKVFIMPTLAVYIMFTLRKQGIKLARSNEDLSKLEFEYYVSPHSKQKLRSLHEYQKATTKRDITAKYPIAIYEEQYKTNNPLKDYSADQQAQLDRQKQFYDEMQALLDKNLAYGQTGLTKAQGQAQQGASISYDKLQKYLGQMQQASGLATGQRGTDFINAQNNYQNTRANIAGSFAEQQNELLNRYAENNLTNRKSQMDEEQGVCDKYLGLSREDEAIQRETAQRGYQNAVSESERKQQQENWDKQFANNEKWRQIEYEYQMKRDEIMDGRYNSEWERQQALDRLEQERWREQQDFAREQFEYQKDLDKQTREDVKEQKEEVKQNNQKETDKNAENYAH